MPNNKITLGILGERLNNLKESLFDKENGALPRLETLFNNHLKHHEKNETKKERMQHGKTKWKLCAWSRS